MTSELRQMTQHGSLSSWHQEYWEVKPSYHQDSQDNNNSCNADIARNSSLLL